MKKLHAVEITVGGFALLLFVLGFAAWWHSGKSLESAIRVSEPVFLGIGGLSIVLLWAQLRSANVQEAQTNLWKRVVSFHDHFDRLPSEPRAQALREYLKELQILDPPTFYGPMRKEIALMILHDVGVAGKSPGRVVLIEYLNDFERFCGAIKAGLVEPHYARKIRGTRVIDACYGFSEFISAYREKQNSAARDFCKLNSDIQYVESRSFCELERVATEWLSLRQKDQHLSDQDAAKSNNQRGMGNLFGQ